MNYIEVRLQNTGLWKIKKRGDKKSTYKSALTVCLQMLNTKVYEHGIMTCANLYIYELGIHNRQIDIIRQASTYMDTVMPNDRFYSSVYTYCNKVYGKF